MLSILKSVKTSEHSSPKTVLGFYAIVLAIVAGASVAVIAVLASRDSLHDLIVPVLVFFALIVVLLLVGVFAITVKDVTKLQLGQMTGTEYIEAQKLVLGDSMAGEFRVAPDAAAPIEAAAKQVQLPGAIDEEPRAQ